MTILNTFTTREWTPWQIILLLFCLFVFAGFSGFMISDSTICGLIAGIIIVGFTCAILFASDKTKDRAYYNVTFDDSVKINDVLDKYTIISHEGKIYTLEAINDEQLQ